MAINPEYAKSILRDENGIILLPQTTASMVSEEPDRRFVDNVEKALIQSLSDNRVALESMSQHATNLVLLAQSADVIIPGSDMQVALQGILSNIESLSKITSHLDSLVAIANGNLELTSSTGNAYSLTIDDTDGNPQMVLTRITNDEETI